MEQEKIVGEQSVDVNQHATSAMPDEAEQNNEDVLVVNDAETEVVQPEAPTWAEADIGDEGTDVSDFKSTSSDQPPPLDAKLTAQVEELKQELETAKLQLEDRNAQYMRMSADFENFRKRTQNERSEREQQVKCSTITELLPVVDNFERARSQIKPQTESEMTIHKSYQSVYKQLVDCLKRIGVSPMRAEGTPFDPNLHEAVIREPTQEYAEGIIMEELMRGYMLGERVIRHAMVKVAAEPELGAASNDSPE